MTTSLKIRCFILSVESIKYKEDRKMKENREQICDDEEDEREFQPQKVMKREQTQHHPTVI